MTTSAMKKEQTAAQAAHTPGLVRMMIRFDECKPHWAEQRGYDKLAAECGLQDVLVTGDFDAKLAYVVGNVTDVAAFRARVAQCPGLSEGSVCEVAV